MGRCHSCGQELIAIDKRGEDKSAKEDDGIPRTVTS